MGSDTGRRHHYRDPVDLLWLRAAHDLGLSVAFGDEVFASYDGGGTLTLCHAVDYDPDDSLAQLILHELCHALVAGHGALKQRDWGMDNVDDRDLLQEHACHRLQAALADRYGLRRLLAVTTDHRSYWDSLPMDPLGAGDDDAIPLARDAFDRATTGPWARTLARALESTRTVASLVREAAPEDNLWAMTQELHESGLPLPRQTTGQCGSCAWSYSTNAALRCRQTKRRGRPGQVVRRRAPGCVRFEPRITERVCGDCGACCREAFHLVEVRPKERFSLRHPTLVRQDQNGGHVPRPDGRCVALTGDGIASPFRCEHYRDRPRSCRDFEPGGDACLEARRKLGLSP